MSQYSEYYNWANERVAELSKKAMVQLLVDHCSLIHELNNKVTRLELKNKSLQACEPVNETIHITRDGRLARVLCTNVAGDYPVLALIDSRDGELPYLLGSDGLRSIHNPKGTDLINYRIKDLKSGTRVYYKRSINDMEFVGTFHKMDGVYPRVLIGNRDGEAESVRVFTCRPYTDDN